MDVLENGQLITNYPVVLAVNSQTVMRTISSSNFTCPVSKAMIAG